MEPNIMEGDILTIDVNAYDSRKPHRWDVVLFESPLRDRSEWVMRVVGLPGETIDFSEEGFTIDGNLVNVPAKLGIKYVPPIEETEGFEAAIGLSLIDFPYTVPEDCYFVMGDNQKKSLDSRYWGGLMATKLRGKVRR